MTTNTSLHNALQAETEKLLGCIHCGLCLPACPTYNQVGNENDSPRGRIYLMRSVAEGRLDLKSESFARHIDLCLGCRACETACPAGVRYGSLLEAARHTLLEHAPRSGTGFQKSALKFALRHIFPNPKRLHLAFKLSRWMRDNALVRFLFDRKLTRRISAKADFALSLLMSTRPDKSAQERAGMHVTQGTMPVAVFTGCVMEGLFQHVNEATGRVLAVNGGQLAEVPTQVCCGALHAHSGDMETARQLARRNIDAFDEFLRADESSLIVINAAGCGALLKEYGELLHDEPQYAERAQVFSSRVVDVTELLARGTIKRGAEVAERVTLDAPCHLYHAQRVTSAPQTVLAAIPGLQYAPLEGMQDCCGGAGIYNLSEPEMSERLLTDKMTKVKATGAQTLVTANPGCHMQLAAGARVHATGCEVAHVIELLDESYQRAGFYEPSPSDGTFSA